MQVKDQQKFSHHAQLDVGLLTAVQTNYAYPRHSHDHYVISLIERGVQSFTLKGTKYINPPSGLILINPDVVHTGEAATKMGFQMRCIYPTIEHMEMAGLELNGRYAIPYFKEVRIDDPLVMHSVFALHHALTTNADPLECESRFLGTLTLLIEQYAEFPTSEKLPGNKPHAVRQVRNYIQAHYANRITLKDLAEHVSLSPYYLLRVFRKEMGMPPHAYLQDVRVQRAKRLIQAGYQLAEVAFAVGFSSQSHLTRRTLPLM